MAHSARLSKISSPSARHAGRAATLDQYPATTSSAQPSIGPKLDVALTRRGGIADGPYANER